MAEQTTKVRELIAFGETPERWQSGIKYMRDDGHLLDPEADTERLSNLWSIRDSLPPVLDQTDHALDLLREAEDDSAADPADTQAARAALAAIGLRMESASANRAAIPNQLATLRGQGALVNRDAAFQYGPGWVTPPLATPAVYAPQQAFGDGPADSLVVPVQNTETGEAAGGLSGSQGHPGKMGSGARQQEIDRLRQERTEANRQLLALGQDQTLAAEMKRTRTRRLMEKIAGLDQQIRTNRQELLEGEHPVSGPDSAPSTSLHSDREIADTPLDRESENTGSAIKDTEEEAAGVEWKPVRDFVTTKETFKSNGPIRIQLNSMTFGVDGLRYTVDWHPLDKDGNRQTLVQSEDYKAPEYGGVVLTGVPSETIIKPPYDHPYGFEVTVKVPPQAMYNKNSAGPYLKIDKIK